VGVTPERCASPPLPFEASPTLIGATVAGAPRKAATSESDRMRYLPSLTEDIEYITTKNASSSVIRSP
jgi:hypothetical protein